MPFPALTDIAAPQREIEPRPTRSAGVFACLAISVLALAVRWPDLSSRPFHTDEANNAYLLQEWLGGHYRYRTHDHHGPLLFDVAGAACRALGVRSVAEMEAAPLRLVSVFAGLALCLTPFLFRGLTRRAQIAAGAFLALAAPLVYYSGLFLHETLLLLLCTLSAAAFWRMRETGSIGAAACAGVAAGLALATKETAAPILALFALCALPGSPVRRRRLASVCSVLVATAALTFATIFSRYWQNPTDAFALARAIGPQLSRGTGTEHAYSFFQYAAWHLAPASAGLPWAAWLLAAAAVAAIPLASRESLPRTLLLWAGALALFFSCLSYKTPWLALAWCVPLCLVAGIAWDRLAKGNRLAGVLIIACALTLLAWETRVRCQQLSVEAGNPFAYSPSSRDLARLDADLARLTAAAKDGPDTLIQVVAQDYWPLPWTLRRYPNVGYWSDVPKIENNAIVLLGPEHAAAFDPDRKTLHEYTIRPGAVIFLRPPVAR